MKKYKIEYDEPARQDMRDLFRFIADSFKAPLTAKRYTQGIYEVVKSLEKSAGSIQISNQLSVLKYGRSTRRINYKKHTIVYTVHGSVVIIRGFIGSNGIVVSK